MQRLEWETETAPNFMLLYTNAYGTETHATTGGTKVMLHAKEGELFFGANKNIVCVSIRFSPIRAYRLFPNKERSYTE